MHMIKENYDRVLEEAQDKYHELFRSHLKQGYTVTESNKFSLNKIHIKLRDKIVSVEEQ